MYVCTRNAREREGVWMCVQRMEWVGVNAEASGHGGVGGVNGGEVHEVG